MSDRADPPPPRSARERILAAATESFERDGVRGTGVNAVIERSGVAKDTLYKHFRTKDDLVVEVLRGQDERWCARLREHVERAASAPAERLLAVFDFLAAELADPGYRGSAFLAASADYPDPGHAVRRACAAHKVRVRAYLAGLASDAALPHPETLGEHLMLLLDGAICARTMRQDMDAGHHARQAAALLVRETRP